MSTRTGYGRWWENYLVRYLMPSIAGIAIVNWLVAVGGDEFRKILFINDPNQILDAPSLVLAFLYGNLFCYVASYPVLIFHSTRCLDFEKNSWINRLSDGYVATAIMGFAAAIATLLPSKCYVTVTIALILAAVFSVFQLFRIKKVFVTLIYNKNEIKHESTLVYAYAHMLAVRRGKIEDIDVSKKNGGSGTQKIETERQRTSVWRKELVDTYRHMREHGNSAFIFVLEFILAALCYLIVRVPEFSHMEKLSLLGLLMAVWAAPAIGVHLLGQHLERRFSLYDFKREG